MKQQPFEDRLPEDDVSRGEAAVLKRLLDQMPAPQVRPAHRAQVLAGMASLLPQRKTRLDHLREWYPLALLYSQVFVLGRVIWLASALVLTLGLLVTLAAPQDNAMLFSSIAPIVAAAGVAVLYNDISQSMLEIESATRASGPVLLLARLTLVFGFNLVFGLLSSVVLVLFHTELLLAPLILSWLAPMTFLCGLAFFMSIITADPLFSAGSGLLLWLVHLLLRRAGDSSGLLFQLASMPGLSDPASRPMLMLVAALLVAAALWLLDIRERSERTSL